MNKIGQKTGDFGKVIALPFSQKSPSKTPSFYIIKVLLVESQADLNMFMAYLE